MKYKTSDPCVEHESLLIATALVLSEKDQLSTWDLVKKLHGSEMIEILE